MELRASWPELEVRIAPCLVNISEPKDTRVAETLASLVCKKIKQENLNQPAVTLVDHGTPRLNVNKVRNFLGQQLAGILKNEASVVTASSMERRKGEEYAFNEPLLENLLGSEGFEKEVILSMLFISPGRHAGPGGDIVEICEEAEAKHQDLKTHMSDLFATDPLLIDLLATRYEQGLHSDPVEKEIPFPVS